MGSDLPYFGAVESNLRLVTGASGVTHRATVGARLAFQGVEVPPVRAG